jgi:uncharacterized small protein (DUF1192 family)
MAPDPAIAVLGVLAVLILAGIVGIVVVARARRRRREQMEQIAEERRLADESHFTVPGSSHDVARWVTEGQQLFTTWQERVERLEELHSRMAAMGAELARLRAEVGQLDELGDRLARLGREVDRLRAERDGLYEALLRVQEIAGGAIGATAKAE